MPQVPKHPSWSRGLAPGLLASTLLLLPVVACGGASDPIDPGTGGAKATGGSAPPATGGTGGGTSTGGASNTGGNTLATGGAAQGGKGVTGGTGGSSTGGAAGGKGGTTPPATGGTSGNRDHCVSGYLPQASDDTMKDGPNEYLPKGKTDPALIDLTLQPEVMSWMTANGWQGGHVEWHAIRTCNLAGGSGLGSKVNICKNPKAPPLAGSATTAKISTNCTTNDDGYQFLLFHRHMMESLKQLWPKHTEQFTGFPKFPTTSADVPKQWQAAWKPFTSVGIAAGKLGDEIDKPENLAKFPDEGALGFWLQCQVGQTLRMSNGQTLRSDGIHFDLHDHWVRVGNTDHGVGNTNVNVENYMFWKLHGWIDNVWEKYRTAKGLKRTDAKYIKDMQDSCHEMDIEAALSIGQEPPKPNTDPLPKESGYFHEKVRPILESQANRCSACHDAAGPEAGMALGGHISSADIVKKLVDFPTIGGGQYKRVTPGKPEQSWLYLKIMAMTGSCTPTGNQCYPSVMPPSSDMKTTVSQADIDVIKKWIMDGAPAPTSP